VAAAAARVDAILKATSAAEPQIKEFFRNSLRELG
jgi:hypothetical protein